MARAACNKKKASLPRLPSVFVEECVRERFKMKLKN